MDTSRLVVASSGTTKGLDRFVGFGGLPFDCTLQVRMWTGGDIIRVLNAEDWLGLVGALLEKMVMCSETSDLLSGDQSHPRLLQRII